MFNKNIKINKNIIGSYQPPFLVAELSANHNGSLETAFKTIKKAKESGADAIKFQTYTADTMTIDSQKKDFNIKSGNWKGYTLYDLYKEAQTPFEWHKELFAYARELDLTSFSSAFDESSIDLLEKLDCCAYKIASFEATDLELIKYAASTKKPIIISTGLASEDEITEIVDTLKETKNQNAIILHCVSSYPASSYDYNLATLSHLMNKFNILVGLSDHTLNNIASISSVSLGACLIEKHFILDRKMKGPDSEFSLEPQDFIKLKKDILEAYKSIGTVKYALKGDENINIIFRRSIYAIKDIKKGELLDTSNVKKIRPGFGLEPKFYSKILNTTALEDILKGDPIKAEKISKF